MSDLATEVKTLVIQVQALAVGMARIEERIIAAHQVYVELKALEGKHDELDRRLVKVSGLNGDNGDMSYVKTKVAEHSEKITSLLLSRAMLIGCSTAAGILGGIAATLAKLLI